MRWYNPNMDGITDLYIACCSKDGGILHATIDGNGVLCRREMVHLDRPMYLAKDGRQLYATLRSPYADSSCSSEVSIAISDDGSLGSCSEERSTHGLVSAYISVLDGRIYTANYLSSSISRIPDIVVEHEGHGKDIARQDAPHPHQIIPTPDGEFLAVCDLGLDAICTYSKNLVLCDEARLPAGSGPRHIAFSQDGGLAFLACELSSETAVLRYCNGHFSLQSMHRGIPSSLAGENLSAAIRTAGDMVYVSQRGYDSITHYRIMGDGLELVTNTSCGGHWPRDFIIVDGFLIVANERSGNLASFKMENGICSEMASELECPSPIALID